MILDIAGFCPVANTVKTIRVSYLPAHSTEGPQKEDVMPKADQCVTISPPAKIV